MWQDIAREWIDSVRGDEHDMYPNIETVAHDVGEPPRLLLTTLDQQSFGDGHNIFNTTII